jgi:competence protein ComEA
MLPSFAVGEQKSQLGAGQGALWPRHVQLAFAFVLGLATAALAIQACSYSRWTCRPSELDITAVRKQRVDINQSDMAQLLQLPGIGETLATRIDSTRLEQGPFQAVEDLTRVHGIGPATVERLRPWVSVGRSGTGEELAPLPLKPVSGKSSRKKQPPSHPINVNTASAEQLQMIPGIGPKTAQRIIETRSKSLFASAEDMRRVPGIGPRILEKIRPYLAFEQGQTSVATALAPSPSTEAR